MNEILSDGMSDAALVAMSEPIVQNFQGSRGLKT
jgi:hypothetical protein